MDTTIATTGIGSWPGVDVADGLRRNLELWSLPLLAEFPARGVGADMIGRTLGQIEGLGFEVELGRWRVADRPGADQRRAAAWLRDDLDMLAEAADGFSGPLKVSLAGPWTLAAAVGRARGGLLVADSGARRDVVAAVGDAITRLANRLVALIPGAEPVIQIDEPSLAAVMAGKVPTESTWQQHRAVPDDEVRSGLEQLVATVTTVSRHRLAVHSCAAVDLALLQQAGVGSLAIDASLLGHADLDHIATHLEAGGALWLGCVATQGAIPTPDTVATGVDTLLRPLEYGPQLSAQVTLTPACGLAGATPADAETIAATVGKAAAILSERWAAS